MNKPANHILWHLIRKEAKQLFPLIAMLAVIGLGLQCFDIYIQFDTRLPSQLGPLTLVGIPCLFAVGVGAMLVGQEKDTRTLQWLRSLPVRKSQLVLAKWIVVLFSLILVWALSWITFFVSQKTFFHASIHETLKESYFFASTSNVLVTYVNSLFLAFLGLALAWRYERSYTALVAVIPTACIPWVLCINFSYFMAKVFHVAARSVWHDWPIVVMLVVATLVACYQSWSMGIKALGPFAAPKLRRANKTSSKPSRPSIAWMAYHPQNQILALSRQFWMQNRLSLMILGGLLLVNSTIAALSEWRRPDDYSLVAIAPVFGLIAALLTAWLGVLSFHGDRLHHRIRFLADRGVRPFLVWRTRHTIPVAILFLTVLNSFVLVMFRISSQSDLVHSIPFSLYFIRVLVVSVSLFVILLVIYAFSQWIGQWVISPIVAAIIAPASCGLLAMYCGYMFYSLGASLLFLPVLALIPFVATARMMHYWMDGKWGMGFHIRNFLWLVAFGSVPIIPIGLHWVTSPQMPSSLHERLSQRAASLGVMPDNSDPALNDFLRARWRSAVNSDRAEPEIHEISRKYGLRFGADREGADESSLQDFWAGKLVFDRLWMEQTRNEGTLGRYRACFSIVADFAQDRRKRLVLKSQEVADATEIVLLRELQRPEALEDLGEELYRKTVASLADTNSRDEARRNALAASWVQVLRYSQSKQELGAYRLPIERRSMFAFRYPSGPSWQTQVIGVKVAHLWDLLETHDPGQILRARERVWKDWFPDSSLPLSDWRSHDSTSSRLHSTAPGSVWRREWEQDAVRLQQSLDQLPHTEPKTKESDQ